MVETRGRPTSEEYLTLLCIKVGDSFVSGKSRDTLYQIARNLRIKVSIKSAGEQGWRVWKMSDRAPRKSLLSNHQKTKVRVHYGREEKK